MISFVHAAEARPARHRYGCPSRSGSETEAVRNAGREDRIKPVRNNDSRSADKEPTKCARSKVWACWKRTLTSKTSPGARGGKRGVGTGKGKLEVNCPEGRIRVGRRSATAEEPIARPRRPLPAAGKGFFSTGVSSGQSANGRESAGFTANGGMIG